VESAGASRHLDAERRMREIIRNAGLPGPDEVHYEFEPDEVVFKWNEPRLAVVIDLDDNGPGEVEFSLAEGTQPAPG
jgi:hypothetical protein